LLGISAAFQKIVTTVNINKGAGLFPIFPIPYMELHLSLRTINSLTLYFLTKCVRLSY